MKKLNCIIVLVLFICPKLFCHKAQKQESQLKYELMTNKWLACETVVLDENLTGENFYSEYLNRLVEFSEEAEQAKPTDTIKYYFPESSKIHDRFCIPTQKLIEIVKDKAVEKTIEKTVDKTIYIEEKTQFLSDSQTVMLRMQICSGIRDWEILQKNIISFELEQVYYSYRILIYIIIISIFLTMVFLVMYLLTSKRKKENTVLAARMLQAQETERERISNELHDTVCQDLRVLQFMQEEIVDKTKDTLKTKIEDSIKLCKKISSDVRNTCYALTPSDLNEGVFEAIISLCTLFRQQNNFEIILSIQDDIKENPLIKNFPKEKNLHIYRIVQELMTNAFKHSQAEEISILIRSFDENNFRIFISDDGKGFDLKEVSKKKNHFGLRNVMSRVENLQGQISYNTEVGAGTQVMVTIPYR